VVIGSNTYANTQTQWPHPPAQVKQESTNACNRENEPFTLQHPHRLSGKHLDRDWTSCRNERESTNAFAVVDVPRPRFFYTMLTSASVYSTLGGL